MLPTISLRGRRVIQFFRKSHQGPHGKGVQIVVLVKSKRAEHPTSEAQRRMGFVLEQEGKLKPGTAIKWSRGVKGKHLPERAHEEGAKPE